MLDQYEKLADLMIKRDREGKPFTFYHYMIDLTGGPCIYKRISGCGSGTEYMAVTPWGDLYPCHQFVGDEKFRLGDIWHGVTNTAVQDEFAACNVYAHRRMPRLLGAPLLLRRLRRKCISRHGIGNGRLQIRLRAFPQTHGMRDNGRR